MPTAAVFRLRDWLDASRWPLASVLPDDVGELLLVEPVTNPQTGELEFGILTQAMTLRLPGMDAVVVSVSPIGGGSVLEVSVATNPIGVRLRGEFSLKIDGDILRPIKAGTTTEPDLTKESLDVSIGAAELSIDATGDVDLTFTSSVAVPRCMVGTTGVILEVGSVRWLSPFSRNLPPNTPASFTGLYFDGVSVAVTGLPVQAGQLGMDDVFIGTGGFSGAISWNGPLSWGPDPQDPNKNIFTGTLGGELFGFAGGLSGVSISFQQSTLTACEITGDVYVPYLEKRIGVAVGLGGTGEITAAAGLPHSTPMETGVTAGSAGYLLHVDVGSSANPFLEIDIDSFRFSSGGGGPAFVEISGALDVNIDGLDAPPFEFNALRINTDGNIAIDGGWLDLREAKLAPFRGFPLEITRLGFGKEDSGCFWVGLNGAIKMADGLPVGASVEGLRICWHPGTSNFDVTLKGVGIEFRIPNTLEFAGTVAFFSDAGNHGFKGSVRLTIVSINLTIDAQLLVGRSAGGDTFFYLYLAVDLPTGIPLFSTGASIYGFAGLIATNMGPTREDGEHWYYGWYLRNPKGVTSVEKWRLRPGAFAAGVGATIGTTSDDGYAFSAKLLLVLLLPGPTFMLTGRGKFIQKRADSQDVQQEGNFDALTVLDFPGKLFQSNLAAAYTYQDLLTIEGGTDVAFSWAPSPPPDIWHIYLGEKAPPEKRIRAQFLKVLRGNSYFQVSRSGIETGTWVGLKDDYRYGPVRAWFEASVSGDAAISWNPPSFVGGLQILGSAGISVFRVTVRISLSSSVTARGPRPWFIAMRVELSIEIDLWFFEFSETIVLPLTWGNANSPLPNPVNPVLTFGAEHLKIDETFRLLTDNTENAPPSSEPEIPPDARPVLIFQRPLSDSAQIGGLSLPAPQADNVGVRTFSYDLAHIVLIRRDGGQRVLCAAGKVTVSGTTATLTGAAAAGLALPGANGASLELIGQGTYAVTGTGTSNLTLSGSPPTGDYAYRLHGRQAVAAVQISAVAVAAYSTAVINLSGNHGQGYGAFAGGTLQQETARWTIVVDTGTSLTVRAPSDPPAMGAATLEAASGGLMEGQWLPVDDREAADDAAPTTKLMLWARTPFAWFRRNGSDIIDGFVSNNPMYPCGPPPADKPTCLDFDDLEMGRLSARFRTDSVPGTTAGTVKVVAFGTNLTDHLVSLVAADDAGVEPAVTFGFMAPVEWLEIRYRADKTTKAFATGRRRGSVVSQRVLPPDRATVELVGPFEELSIIGRSVLLESICVRPRWICVTFDEKAIPARSTGHRQVDDVIVETTGTMEVLKGDVLTVFPPGTKESATGIPTDGTGRVHPKYEVLPGAPRDRVLRLLGQRATAPHTPVPRVEMSGIRTEMPTYLPGIGAAIVVPPGRPRPSVPRPSAPNPRDWRWAKPVPLLERTLPSAKLAQLRAVDGGTEKAVASIAFVFPHPVTRVHAVLVGKATVVGYRGTEEVVRREGGDEISLSTPPDYIDRLMVFAPEAVRIVRVCYDDGTLGWQLVAQDGWQASLAHSIAWMYREDPILTPGDYRLELVTETTITGASPGTNWTKAGGNFKVGQPPGTRRPTSNADLRNRYPFGGPLTELSTYVDGTMPAAGQRPFYRSYDVGVIFDVPYVSRMFLAAGKQLSLVVLDSNDRERRNGTGTIWGEGSDLALSNEVADWIATVNAGEGSDCPTINVEQVALRSEEVHVGAGELLAPNELHGAEIRALGSTDALYRFEFVTSRFTNFRHHIAMLDGHCRPKSATRPGAYDSLKLVGIRNAMMEIGAQGSVYLSARSAATTGSPTKEQLDTFAEAETALAERFAAFVRARVAAFDEVWSAYFVEPPSALLPGNVEISRVVPPSGSSAPVIFLLESPEPLLWDRIYHTIGRSGTVPLRRRNIAIDRDVFGAPDAGTTFEYGGCRWTTDVELQVTPEGVAPRVAGPWNISIAVPGATWIELTVRVASTGGARLHGEGTGVSADATQGPTGSDSSAPLAISADALTRVLLTGNDTTIVSLTVIERFRPEPPRGSVRLVRAILPVASDDSQHFVELTTYLDVDISGWTIRWSGAASPGETAVYHVFAPATLVKDGEFLRVYGAISAPASQSGFRVFGGGTVGAVPSDGLVLQLFDTQGQMVHEIAALPETAFPSSPFSLPESLAVSVDGTRALFIPVFGSYQAGQWRLRLQMSRSGDWGRPAFSVGGDTSAEIAVMQFTAE